MLHFPEQKTKAVKQRRPGGACGPCRASVWEKSASPPPVASTLPELSLPPNARPQMRLPRSKIPHHGPLLQLPRENVQRTPLCFTEKSPLMMAVVPRKEGRRQGTVGGGERALPPPPDFMSAQTTASVQPLRPPPGLPNFGLAGGSHPFPRPLGPPANDHPFLLSCRPGAAAVDVACMALKAGRNRHPAHRRSPSPQLLLSPCLCVYLCPSFSVSPCRVSTGQEGSLLRGSGSPGASLAAP